jgi:two-component system, NtrC family, sensor kinase
VYALVVLTGPDSGRRFPLPDREPQLIGRSTEAIPVADESVSRRHAELTPDDGRWWIRDLESTNGTFVNGEPILDRVPVQPGDRIRCGDTEFQLRHLDESAVHGRLHAPDPADAVVRLVPASTTGPRPDPGPILDHGTSIADRLPAVAMLLDAESAAVIPIDSNGLCLDGLDVRTPGGGPPPTPFVLPRELVAALVADPASGPRVAVIDDRTAVAAVLVGGAGGRRLIAASRSADHGWNTSDLRTLDLLAGILGRDAEASDLAAVTLRTERLAAMGEATAALSHSVKNILQGMRGGADAVELALNRERLDLAREGWQILARNLDRIMSLSLNMLAYSKDRELDIIPVTVGSIASEAIAILRSAAERAGVTLELVPDPHEPPIPIDPDAIHQVVLNLVGNAIEAVDRGGRVEVRTAFAPDQGSTTLLVTDDGPGVPLDRRERIFEPFYSTRGQRGTGLGLAVARKLVERHGGTLVLDPPAGRGAVFRVNLPASRNDEPGVEDTRGPNPIQGGELGVRFGP